MMASLAIRSGLSGSQSPFSGAFSLGTDTFVKSKALQQRFDSEFPEEYFLSDLTGARAVEERAEATARDWLRGLFRSSNNLEIVADCNMPNPLRPSFQPFYKDGNIRPDVTVILRNAGLSILTIEIVCGAGPGVPAYESTVAKTILNCIEMLRIWRAHNASVDECTSFVVPNDKDKSCVMKVSVKFKDLMFCSSTEYLTKGQVGRSIRGQIEGWTAPVELTPVQPYYIRLKQEELDMISQGAVQVPSRSSLILKNGSTFWKLNKYASKVYLRLAVRQISMEQLTPGGRMFLRSLLPFAEEYHRPHHFHKFVCLQKPLSREEAKPCLLTLLDGLHPALEELHDQNIAHLDVRLPNICFSGTRITLIDLDQCDYADISCVRGTESDMHLEPEDVGEWTNSHADWRCVGMMICYILDTSIQDYHLMLTGNEVKESLRNDPFINRLLEKGEWDDTLYEHFKVDHHTLNEPVAIA